MTIKITKAKYEEILVAIRKAYRYSMDGVEEHVLFNPKDGCVWVSHYAIIEYNDLYSCIDLFTASNNYLWQYFGQDFKGFPSYTRINHAAAAIDWNSTHYMLSKAYSDFCDEIANGDDQTIHIWADDALKRSDIEVEQ